ncbi:DNA polymerase III subunit delta [bacterium]|nr:DNA polymerase III subunit delta [bacterium]
MDSKSAISILKSGSIDIYPAYIVEGNDRYLIFRILQIIKSSVLDPDFAEFNYTKLECDGSTKLREITNVLLEQPMLADRRLSELHQTGAVKYKAPDGPKTSKERLSLTGELESIVSENLEQGANIICIVNCGQKSDGKDLLKSLIKDRALTVNCTVYADDIPKWLAQEAQSRGYSLNIRAASELCERVGTDLAKLSSQLGKLCAYAGENKSLTLEDVKAIAEKSLEIKVWDFTSAVSRRNASLALRCCAQILQDNDTADALSLLAYTNTYLRSLAQTKALVKRLGGNPALIAGSLSGKGKKKTQYQISKDIENSALWSEKALKQAFLDLCQTDMYLKTGASPLLTVQKLAMRLACRPS